MIFNHVRLYVLQSAIVCGFVVTLSCYSAESSMKENTLISNSKPWCIGRLLIDRPRSSKLVYEKYEYWGDSIEVTAGTTPVEFRNLVNLRERELLDQMRSSYISYQEMKDRGLKSMKIQTNKPWLEKSTSPTPDSNIFIFKEFEGEDSIFMKYEGHVLAGSSMLTFRLPIKHADIDRAVSSASDVYRNVAYRDDWTVPAERGFCIKGALIGGPSRNSELVEQTINLLPDGYAPFVVAMREAVPPDQKSSLLASLPDLRNQLHSQGYGQGVRVLREGKRRIADMDAEEVLFAIQQDGALLYRFYLIAAGTPGSTAQPHTEIRFLLGQQPSQSVPLSETNSPVDEATAIQTWDSMLDSLRLRPGAM